VKKVIACTLLIFLGLAFSVPAVAYPRLNSAQREMQKNTKKVLKRDKKQRKRDMKTQKQAMKDWQKYHHTGI